MKLKSKKILFTILLLVMFIMVNTNIYAASATVTLKADNTTLQPGQEVAIVVTVKDISGFLDSSGAEQGIMAFKGVLSYDKNVFEEIVTEGEDGAISTSITGLNLWETPSYNSATFEMATMRGAFVKTTQDMIQIKLKVKSGIADTTTTVALNNISVSDDAQQIDKGAGSNASVTLKIQSATNPINNTTNNTINNTTNNTVNNVIRNNTIRNNNTTVNSILPQTGTSSIIAVIMAVIAVNAFIAYIKYKK